MPDIDYIPIGELDVVDSLPAGAQVLINDSGSAKLLPAGNLPTAGFYICTQGEYDALAVHNPGQVYLIVETVAAISVTTQPAATNYEEGDALDLTGLVVTATYPSGATLDVTERCTFSPSEGSILDTVGTLAITVSYTEGIVTKTTTFSVNVEAVS